MQTQKQKKMPWSVYAGIVIAATGVMMITLLFPIWQWFPVLVTEDVKVIAVTEDGCVAESATYGYPVVVEQCTAKVGDTISASFYVPAIDQSGYDERVQEKLELVIP